MPSGLPEFTYGYAYCLVDPKFRVQAISSLLSQGFLIDIQPFSDTTVAGTENESVLIMSQLCLFIVYGEVSKLKLAVRRWQSKGIPKNTNHKSGTIPVIQVYHFGKQLEKID